MTDFSRLSRANHIRATGLSGTTVDRQFQRGAPRNPDGTIPFPAWLKWYVEQKSTIAASPARERLLSAQAKRAELRNLLEEGEVVAVEDAARILENVVLVMRQKILNFGNIVSPKVVGCAHYAEVKSIIDNYAADVLTEISQIDPDGKIKKKRGGSK